MYKIMCNINWLTVKNPKLWPWNLKILGLNIHTCPLPYSQNDRPQSEVYSGGAPCGPARGRHRSGGWAAHWFAALPEIKVTMSSVKVIIHVKSMKKIQNTYAASTVQAAYHVKSKLMNLKFFKIYTCVFTGKTWILSIYMYLGTLLVKLQ